MHSPQPTLEEMERGAKELERLFAGPVGNSIPGQSQQGRVTPRLRLTKPKVDQSRRKAKRKAQRRARKRA